MEPAQAINHTERRIKLEHWLKNECQLTNFNLTHLAGDASFRRYYRLYIKNQQFVVMDAPPEKENCQAFIAIAKALQKMNINVPEIYAENLAQGFLLLTDFGDATFLKTLNSSNADKLYGYALQTLANLNQCRAVANHALPTFTIDFMQQEWQWHKEWFLQKLCAREGLKELDQEYTSLVQTIAQQPYVFMHRDYHSANLMWVNEEKIGVLDFQDAFIGPVTYDLVSLLRDCYIAWPAKDVKQWVQNYLELLKVRGQFSNVSKDEFLKWFDWMGIQRHLKALMTFARKYVRDQQDEYLQHIPRTLQYIEEVSSQYTELKHLNKFYSSILQSHELPLCAQ